MSWSEIKNLLNNNQGVVAVSVFIFGSILALILTKLKKGKSSKIMTGNIQAGGDVIVADRVVFDQIPIDPESQKTLGEIRVEINGLREKYKPSWKSYKSSTKIESQDFERVKKLIAGGPTNEATKELRVLFYSSSDNVARLQIALTLANWCCLPEDSIDDLITFCDEGMRIADSISSISEKSILLAYKGRFISTKFVSEDEEGAFKIRATNLIGVPLISPEERNNNINRLHGLEKLANDCFTQAEELAIQSNNPKALALIRSLIGEAAGERYIHFNYFGMERAEEEKSLCKRALMSAKEIYSKIGDKLGVAYALHNLANQLRFFGEKEEAIKLTEEVIKIANEYNEQKLLKKAKILRERLIGNKDLDSSHKKS